MNNLARFIAIFLVLTSTVNIAFSQTKKAADTEPAPNCFISEFRHIALSVHEPIERANQVKRWLAQNLTSCSFEKLIVINANRASWLGTSDSSYFMNALDSMLELKQAGKPEMAAQIYGSLGKEGASSIQVMSVTQAARAQQVQPTYDNQQYQQQAYPQAQQQPAYQQAYPQAQQQPAYPQAYPQAQQQPANPQAYPQAQQQPAYPQAAYPPANPGGK